MEDFVDSLKDLYLEKITTSFSPQKLLIFVLFTLAQIIIQDSTHGDSFFLSLIDIKIQDLFDFDDGFFSKVRILNLILSFFLTTLNFLLYNKLKIFFFNQIPRQKKFKSSVNKMIQNTRLNMSLEKRINIDVMHELAESIKRKKLEFIQKHDAGIISMTFLLMGLVSLYTPTKNDIFVCALLSIFILWIQRNSYVFYLSKLVPLLVVHKVLLEKEFDLQDSSVFDKE